MVARVLGPLQLPTGQPFTGKVVSYEGQIFYIEGKDGKLYPLPFKQLSANDQKYLIEQASGQKIPKGDPRKISANNEMVRKILEQKISKATDNGNEHSDDIRLKPKPKVKPKLRPGSFFAYKPVGLGQDPAMAA